MRTYGTLISSYDASPIIATHVRTVYTHPLPDGLDDAHGVHGVGHAEAEARDEHVPVLELLLGLVVFFVLLF